MADEQSETELVAGVPVVQETSVLTVSMSRVVLVDPETGERLPPDEAAGRLRIQEDAQRGLVGVDRTYYRARHAIHQPLLDEEGEVVADAWQIVRANRTSLRVNLTALDKLSPRQVDRTDLEELAVTVARSVGGDLSADLMKQLYVYANDAGRTGRFTVKMNELLDALEYKRDSRGIHRSDARQRVSRALLALQFTQIGINVSEGDENIGTIAPLIATLQYRSPRTAADLTAHQIFELGLPETITVTIHPQWYDLRDASGRLTPNPLLVPRASLAPGERHNGGWRRLTAAQALRQYLEPFCEPERPSRMTVTRKALIKQANITDRSRTNSLKTLARALDRLQAEGLLLEYGPKPLPADDTGQITLVCAALP